MDRQGLISALRRLREGVGRLREGVAELRARPTSERASHAIARQLDYQRRKAAAIARDHARIERIMSARTNALVATLAPHVAITSGTRVLEVGSGAHGHVFFLGVPDAIGVDPLADEYRALFPWQPRARTIAAYGEHLPFDDARFDLVVSDNVIDHAERPAAIVDELVRVLAPGGVLYFTVHVHHPIYDALSRAYGLLTLLGLPRDLGGPFADHTVHLTARDATRLVERDELEILHRALLPERTPKRRRRVDHLKRVLAKNTTFEVIARRRA
ncbi:class I SAM-dependent methyltransferase [Sandaracinus amylolyticus]|uniref:class I SAM-dependent methyltransferase n=1 Tax=Sandaracinus amylolyticus TaxID=927083 RepID=UPI001F1FC2FF|nr:class I SAM-dependent methyltransferase [Sandaracinus amylolyticus]UJR80442.1 Class I SAM-dependent methyltransferase [Sandaracinus amylolyticus]